MWKHCSDQTHERYGFENERNGSTRPRYASIPVSSEACKTASQALCSLILTYTVSHTSIHFNTKTEVVQVELSEIATSAFGAGICLFTPHTPLTPTHPHPSRALSPSHGSSHGMALTLTLLASNRSDMQRTCAFNDPHVHTRQRITPSMCCSGSGGGNRYYSNRLVNASSFFFSFRHQSSSS